MEINKIPQEKIKKEVEYTYTWRKDKGFIKNGYIKTDKENGTK